jgi:hypothetical protein
MTETREAPTPREVPVREAPAWPHEKRNWTGPIKDNPPHCRYCERPWPCPSQQLVAARDNLIRELVYEYHHSGSIRDHADPKDRTGWNVKGIETCDDTLCVEARLILEGARATDDEGQR